MSDIFGAKVYFERLKSPWALFLTKEFQKWSKFVPLIGQKNFLGANQRGGQAG